MSLGIVLIILLICLLAEGFFSGSEMAIVNADKSRLANQTIAGSKLALSALHLVKHPANFFSTTLVGTNICTVAGTVITTFYIMSHFGEQYTPLAIIYWPFTLLLGEVVPKSIYQYYADKLVLKVSPILFVISIILLPIIWPLTKFTNLLLKRVKLHFGAEPPITREELEHILEVNIEEPTDVLPIERKMIARIFDLAEKKVSNIMTPMVDIVAVSIDASREEAEKIVEQSGYSRLPVYSGRLFNIVGILSSGDLLFSEKGQAVKELIRPAYYVPENMPLDELLIAMKRQEQPLSIVVDEFGAATGIVSVEDLLEEIVGDIRDEHDVVSLLYQRIGHRRYLVSGRLEIEHANTRLNLGIPDGEYETLAGFLLKKAERIPRIGESLTFGNWSYTIRRATERAILEVEISETTDLRS